MRLLCVSSRSISFRITVRAAGDGSQPSKVISGAICISVLLATPLLPMPIRDQPNGCIHAMWFEKTLLIRAFHDFLPAWCWPISTIKLAQSWIFESFRGPIFRCNATVISGNAASAISFED
jgi:hypothetical protein